MANGRLSGVKKQLINRIFRVTGKITRFANVVNFPVTNDNPHKNSIDFAKGNK